MFGRILSICLLVMLCIALPVYAEEAISTLPQRFTESSAQPTEWVYVTRDGDSATYLAMDTIDRQTDEHQTIFYGDVKKVYTRSGLLQVYHSLKAENQEDAETLSLLKQIDYSIAHVSYCNDDSSLSYRLHWVTFYNKNQEPLLTLDFDDMARQADTAVAWQPITARTGEERAIFYRMANG